MSTLLQTAAGIDDLLRVGESADTPYRFERIFEGEGWTVRRLHKRRLDLLRRLEAQLPRMLEPDERVEHVSWGVEFAFVEAYFLGLWHVLLNRRALVLTDRRLLLLQIDSRRRPKPLKSQVRRGAIARVTGGSLGMLSLRLRDGARVVLSGGPRRDRAALRTRLAPGAEAAASAVRGREHLCPHCHAPAGAAGSRPERCPQCRGGFKSAARAGWLSFAFPGLGDLYLGHRALAAFEIVGALALWGVFLPVLAVLALGDASQPGSPSLALGVGGVLFLVSHGVDAWVTRHVARKGLYPASG